MKSREDAIIEFIGTHTKREYVILESKENLLIHFKKSDEKSDTELRKELEKALLEFHPRILFVNFF